MLHIYLLALVQIFGCKEFNQPDVVIHERPKPVIVKNFFRSPVDHTFKIAGTFCELRPNHFHTGIDIKSSNGVQGDNIYAIADGYISRIGISPTGYGLCTLYYA
jgi:murein DD-endopeptidase MepM/ murein hydrolase activator NlpD